MITPMSTTIIAVMVQLLSVGLPMIGVQVGSAELTSMLQTLIVVVSGVWIWVRRYQAGGITPLGSRV